MKRLLLSLIIGMSLNAASSSLVELTSRPKSPDRLFHDGNSFIVQRMGTTYEVPSYTVDREIRNHDVATLLKLQEHGYFDVQRSINGEDYRIEFKPKTVGGGVVGAWLGFWAGHLLVTAPSYAVIGIISACTGPMAGATFATISVYASPAILATANVVALSTGLAAGVATGPV